MIVSGKSTFKPAPEGVKDAVCVDVVDLGMLPTQWGPKHKCRIVFQIADIDPDTKKRYLISRRFTASLDKRADLNKFLKQWRGKEFTKEEIDAFDMEKLVGAQAQLVIQHAEREGTIYADINTVLKGKTKLELDKTYVRIMNRKEEQESPSGQADAPTQGEQEVGDPF